MEISVILALIFCLNTSIFAYQAEVENISNSDYFQPALDSINNAKESIVMGMYIISLPSGNGAGKVRQLLRIILGTAVIRGCHYPARQF